MENIITDAQKVQSILDELSISSYRLTQELKLSASAIYHVLNGKNQLSMNLIDKICTAYPQVSKKYLTKGIGEPLIEQAPSSNDEYILVKKQDLDHLKQDISTIYKILKTLT